jgi:hypothetical protein
LFVDAVLLLSYLDADNQEIITDRNLNEATPEQKQSAPEANRDRKGKREASESPEGTKSNLENYDEEAMDIDGPE